MRSRSSTRGGEAQGGWGVEVLEDTPNRQGSEGGRDEGLEGGGQGG